MSGFYETDRAVAEYLLFHYAPADVLMPWANGPRWAAGFAVRCVTETFLRNELPPEPRALDLGCAVGRSSFELSRFCGEVVAIDSSPRFIDAARRLQSNGEIPYSATIEGELREDLVAALPAESRAERVQFEVGDALDLRPDLADFDLVLAANLLDRVPDPMRLLGGFERLVRPGGQLVLTSPYTWLEEYTARREWLSHEGQRTSERLAGLLPGFTLVRRQDLPFVLREHARKFQWSVAEATTWRRI